MALSLEGYVSLRSCCREMGEEAVFLRLPLRDAALARGLLAIGSGLFREKRFDDALHLLQVAVDGGLDQLQLREGQARALVRLKRYAEAESLLLVILDEADARQRLSLNKVLRVCRMEAAQLRQEQDETLLNRWHQRLEDEADPLPLHELEELAQLVLNRDGEQSFSALLNQAIELRLNAEDPAWQELSPLIRRWQQRIECTEVLLQRLESRTH